MHNTKRALTGLFLLILFLAILVGNIHVVSQDGTYKIVNRSKFGFSDFWASVEDCTGVPWIVAQTNHGELCRALQKAKLIESDAARERRLETEFSQKMEHHQREIEERMIKAQEEIEERMKDAMKNY